MANIGSLDIDLTLKTARFNSDVEKAKKQSRSLRNSIQKDMRTIRRAAGEARKSFNTLASVGAAAAAAGLALVVNRSIEVNDQMVKTADKIGIATDKLAGLRHAANITGVEAKALDKGLQTMQKTITDLSKGVGVAVKDYERLGLTSKELLALPADEQFKLIAERLNEVQNATERVGIAYNIFGGRGTALVNTLALGRDGMEKMQAEAEALGIALSRVDAAKIEAAKDAMTRSGEAVAGLGNKFTVALAPILVVIGNRITGLVKDSNKMADEMGGFVGTITSAAANAADVLRGLEVVFKGLNIAATAFVSAALTAFDELQKGVVAVANVLPGVDIKPNAALSQWAEDSRQAVIQLEDELGALVDKPMPSENVKKFMEDVQADAQKAAEDIAASAKARGIGVVRDVTGGEDLAKAAEHEQKMRDLLQVAQATRVTDAIDYFDKLRSVSEAAMMSDEERANAAFQKELDRIEEHRKVLQEAGLLDAEMQAEINATKEAAEAVHQDKLNEIRKAAADRRAEIESKTNDMVLSMQAKAYNMGIGLLQKFAKDNKAINVILTALRTAQAVADIQTAAATTSAQVLAYGEVEAAKMDAIVPGSGMAARAKAAASVASIESYAAVATGLAIASGVVTAAGQLGGGGGSVSASTGGGGAPAVPTSPAAVPAVPTAPQTQQPRQTTVIFQNPIMSRDFTINEVLPTLQEVVATGDVVLIDPRSANAQIIQEGMA